MSYKISPFTFSYSEQEETKKLHSKQSIELLGNEMIAIVGPSGAGKSTLLKILKGLIPEYSSGKLEGEITFNGNPLTGEHFKSNLKDILYLFQNPFSQVIYPDVEEEFVFSMENFNFSKEEITKKTNELNDVFKLDNLWRKKTKNLSNGECQKLVLTSMLAINPKVILLDEPTAFMDPETRREFYAYLQELKKDRMIIIVDHHLSEISSMVDRYLTIDRSGEVFDGFNENAFLLANDTNELSFEYLKELKSYQGLTLKIENLLFSYEHRVENLLKIKEAEFLGGEVVTIKGKNGAGKSTLFKLLLGLLKPKQGYVRLNNQTKIFSDIAMVFQNPENHFFFDTVKEELLSSIKKEKLENTIKLLFHSLELEKSPFLLSEGEKRRLSLLMTLFLEKKVILYDEPTFGQDESSKKAIALIIKEMKKRGVIQIIISHDEDFIRSVSDKVLVLDKGELYESR